MNQSTITQAVKQTIKQAIEKKHDITTLESALDQIRTSIATRQDKVDFRDAIKSSLNKNISNELCDALNIYVSKFAMQMWDN